MGEDVGPGVFQRLILELGARELSRAGRGPPSIREGGPLDLSDAVMVLDVLGRGPGPSAESASPVAGSRGPGEDGPSSSVAVVPFYAGGSPASHPPPAVFHSLDYSPLRYMALAGGWRRYTPSTTTPLKAHGGLGTSQSVSLVPHQLPAIDW